MAASGKDNRDFEEYMVYLSPYIEDAVLVKVNDQVKITGTYRCTECNNRMELTAEAWCPRCSRCGNGWFYID